jgi:N-acetylglucosaminyldiphosphoundecaprenol N-acetyl-beta-D-mannosaminyltransferase
MTSATEKANILGVLVSKTNYARVVSDVVKAANSQQPLSVAALPVHGIMTGVLDQEHKYRLNHFDIVAPDGQPVRWALNLLHGARLRDRVYGPNLMLAVCARAEQESLPIFLYGSSIGTLDRLVANLRKQFPRLQIAGVMPGRYSKLTQDEKTEIAAAIRNSGARIVFVALGCPRQEVWAYEFRDAIGLPILTVGAAFPFHAKDIPQAPLWMQNAGLEWLFRLRTEPRRLWRRYLLFNPAYLFLLACQAVRLKRFRFEGTPPKRELHYG